MPNALFINGIFDSNVTDILSAQELGASEAFLQPYAGRAIAMLRDAPPSRRQPVRLYLSTTEELGEIRYTAEILKWENKHEMSASRRSQVTKQLKKYQSSDEVRLFSGKGKMGNKPVNLITIRNLTRLTVFPSTSVLRKVSDGEPLKKRTQAGGWSEVFDAGDLISPSIKTVEEYESDLEKEVKASSKLSNAALKKRLANATGTPERTQLVTTGYKRNPDVIAFVLRRAGGICESCSEPAPFNRRSDGSPYLEVHHWEPLSQGGEDTVDNAGAICPNCHREEHYGEE